MSRKNASHWIKKLELEKHPFMDSGYFKEIFRDDQNQVVTSNEETRAASTLIYFLHLPEGSDIGPEKTFYRSKSSVISHFYDGQPIKIFLLDKEKQVQSVTIGPDTQLHYVVKPGTWFSRFLDFEPKEDLEKSPFSLVGVTVAPGFDLRDLENSSLKDIQSSK